MVKSQKGQSLINNSDKIPQIRFMNIQGIHPGIKNKKWKIPALSEELKSDEKYTPFLVFIETHLNSDILDAEVQLHDYNIYRSDRVKRKQGGAMIYSHKDIIIDDTDIYSNEYCSVIIVYSKQLNILLSACYRPPNAPETSFKKCLDLVNK